MEIDEAIKEIHRLRMILVKKAAASASTVKTVGPATRAVIGAFQAFLSDDMDMDLCCGAPDFECVQRQDDVVTLRLKTEQIKAFLAEQEPK